MAWIARDKDGSNPCRLFGVKPVRAMMVSYEGEVSPNRLTWTVEGDRRVNRRKDGAYTYGPLVNSEPTVIGVADIPIHLEPGDGPIEVALLIPGSAIVPPRSFEGAGI